MSWHIRERGRYRTTRSLLWEVGKRGSGARIIVPPEFPFDVTIFWWLRWAFDPHRPEYLKASAIHDWLLEDGWDRVTAGAVFHEVLRTQDVSLLRRLAMWLGTSLWRYR